MEIFIANKFGWCGVIVTKVSDPPACMITGLFVPLHFRSRDRKDHRENFHSRGTFAPGERKVQELSFHGTFAPQERMFQELSFYGTFAPLEPSLHKQLSCPLTFAPVAYLQLLLRAAVLYVN